MRALIAALLATTALPAFADTILADSTITAVTVYPDGARITREVRFAAPGAGSHEVLVTDMPWATDPGTLRLQASDGTGFGAFSLRADRLPPRADPLTPDQEAAKAAVRAAEAAERQALAAVEAVQARVAAANAQVAFLSSFSGALPDNATPDAIRAMAAMIGAETLAASELAALARADLWPAQDALSEAQRLRAEAQAAFDALPGRDTDYTALVVAVDVAAAGEAMLTVTHYVGNAGWRPFYEMNLTRDGAGSLVVDRSVLVTQFTGEDWSGVDLTLSTARPADQAAPSPLWPDLRSIGPEEMAEDAMMGAGRMAESEAAAEPVMAPAPITAGASMQGDVVVYTYPRAVDVASGVEDLRLALDQISLQPVIYAAAVPRWDATAFVMAEFVNTTGEPLLPGEALLFREGELVGGAALGTMAAGAEATLAFGALEAIRIGRDMPVRDSGQSGFLVTSNEASEAAVLVVENLGDEVWPLRVVDQVPYSEQEDLEIAFEASLEPTEVDVDGQRGVLAWEFDLAPGEKREISLSYSLSWPDGMVLR